MNKYLIPAILGAVVLMAGMFAFMPVQKAQTFHSDLINEIQVVGNEACQANGTGDTFDRATNSCVFLED